MTLQYFMSLTEDEQLAVVEQRGVYIGKRKGRPYQFLLYQIESFYVEIVYYKYRLEVAQIVCTKNTCILDAYRNYVDIGLLVN